jgi:hypothetical protein
MITKEMLDSIQADYDAGLRADNKLVVRYNYDILVTQNQHQIFDQMVLLVAQVMEKDGISILSNMHATGNFYDEIAIFEQEFGSRITLLPGAETVQI